MEVFFHLMLILLVFSRLNVFSVFYETLKLKNSQLVDSIELDAVAATPTTDRRPHLRNRLLHPL